MVMSVGVKQCVMHDKRHVVRHAHTHLHTHALAGTKSHSGTFSYCMSTFTNAVICKISIELNHLVLPEANGIAEGWITIAIFGVDGSPLTQKILHHFQMPFTCGDVERGTAIIIAHAQVSALNGKINHLHFLYCIFCLFNEINNNCHR